ncbi:MAG TPA: DUF423 domain-containing protein [Casimicrobiaceae bacterium]|nr:DUF423 domain-containing protein [Casimicrobiaceae bacterium]
MSARLALVLGAAAMFLAVALGAFGAHALKARLPADMTAVWQTAVQYHAWHALALLATGLLLLHREERAGLGLAAWLFVAGIVLFSGSLYAMALTGVRGLGAVTPIGGVAFLAGWTAMVWAIARG